VRVVTVLGGFDSLPSPPDGRKTDCVERPVARGTTGAPGTVGRAHVSGNRSCDFVERHDEGADEASQRGACECWMRTHIVLLPGGECREGAEHYKWPL